MLHPAAQGVAVYAQPLGCDGQVSSRCLEHAEDVAALHFGVVPREEDVAVGSGVLDRAEARRERRAGHALPIRTADTETILEMAGFANLLVLQTRCGVRAVCCMAARRPTVGRDTVRTCQSASLTSFNA